jgi:hypothetical protein
MNVPPFKQQSDASADVIGKMYEKQQLLSKNVSFEELEIASLPWLYENWHEKTVHSLPAQYKTRPELSRGFRWKSHDPIEISHELRFSDIEMPEYYQSVKYKHGHCMKF